MSFAPVLAQYVKAIANQGKRRARQGRDFFTKDEQKALAYYAAASVQINNLGGNDVDTQEVTQEVTQETESD